MAAFEVEVAKLGPPPAIGPGDEGWRWDDLSSPCLARLRWIRLSERSVVDRGYLFLQAPDALTDVSGVVYLPEGNKT